ncbi:hypothetical protein GDO81_011795 [Engystomops pustulosus]|uniref:Uncharacterized protein n=1 Tax=Engystomops pustulosus TaxID=76066 RepID=A0AAV7BGT1_ENGPU|nr:hypothetical protein GDO81_011795 [Engystomops pustulosus]
MQLTDCWKHKIQSTNYSPELVCSVVVFLSIIIMFLSYICLKKTFTQYLLRRQKSFLFVRPNVPKNVELL